METAKGKGSMSELIAQADNRKLCTCDGDGRGPGRPCVVRAGERLGDLWRCARGLEAQAEQPAEPVAQVVSSGEYELPCLQWISADHSFRAPIGTKLYAHPDPRLAALEADLAAMTRAHGVAECMHIAETQAAEQLRADLAQAVQMYTDAAGERDKALADLAAAQARIERYEALLNRCSDACKVVPVLVRNGEHISLPTHIEKAIGKDRHEGCPRAKAERGDDLAHLRERANALLHQIDIGDYVDSEGHALKNNIAVLTLMKALTNV